jgi:FtsP/CotA-like multicopper oxidase with cupredoxin domain
MAMLSRRQLLIGAISVGGGAVLAGESPLHAARKLGSAVEPSAGKTVAVELIAAERATALPCFGGRSLPLWTFGGEWPPLIRLNLGDRLEAMLENQLPRSQELTSIHWHGIRLPNNQDGVPYLVQAPVRHGERFRYSFAPTDAGTFFFHTHCNTVEQLGRGLEGILIVDGDTTEAYDADTVLLLRDWQVDLEAGEFNPFFTLRGAARAGTYGPVRSINGAKNPEIVLPASGDCRARLINTDPTRVMQISIESAEAYIIAVDGIAVQPFPFAPWVMGPGTRIDVVLRAPRDGRTAQLIDMSHGGRVELAHFIGKGPSRRKTTFDPAPLRASRIPEPNLNTAERLHFVFQASDGERLLLAAEDPSPATLDSLCLSSKIFWKINGRPWPDIDHARLPPPLAVLARGNSYVLVLENDSEFVHPIHIHGHTFKFLHSNRQSRPQHHADTILLLPREKAEVAFVADNPGDWMLHCHVIEHQETGMMGYLRVV